MERDFLGRGWSFPPDFGGPAAGVTMLKDEADVASSLQVLLGTRPGERVMQPRFGCNLSELVFADLDTRTKTLIADKIESAVLYFEPRVTLDKVTLDDSDIVGGVVLIRLVYTVKSTNSRFNFVYPYYIREGTDINLTTINLLPDDS
jgi:phage baseplate assembly protein W